MPIRLSEMQADRRTVMVRFDSGELRLTYRPSAMNEKAESDAKRHTDEGETIRAEVTLLTPMILDWDLEGDDGQILPVSADMLASLGLPNVIRISRAIMDDAFPNRNRGKR